MQARTVRPFALHTASVLLIAATAACGDDYGNDPQVPLPTATVVTATGDVTAKLTEFRALLGEPLNGGTAGQQPAGRREVNWDGVNAANTNTNTFPIDFFAARGLITTTPGTGLRVSDNDFGDVNALYDDEFEQFSGARTFMAIGSNVMDVVFRVAGDTASAGVRGFGVILSDVDNAASTTVEFIDAAGRSLKKVTAPVRSDAKGHSFVGATFADPIVVRVRIVIGQASLGSQTKDVTNGGTLDLVVMDDFLYSEPNKR